MKVKADSDIYRDGRLVVSKGGIYTVTSMSCLFYAVYVDGNEIRVLPKEFFTVVPEGDVE